jgi:hypothetical protein
MQVALRLYQTFSKSWAASLRTLNLFIAMYIVLSPWPRAGKNERRRRV